MHGLLPLLLVGCAGVAAAPPPPAQVHHPLGEPLVVAGESMVYEVSFRGFQLARVQVAVGKPGWTDGRPAVIVRSRGETDGVLALLGEVDWELATTIDLERGTPLKSTEHAVVKFRGKTDTNHRDRGAESVHTLHSAAGILRGWKSAIGQRGTFEVRVDAARFQIAILEAAREFLDGVGKPAVRYDGVANEKFAFELWLSDDAARVPLRLHTATKWGDVAIELVEYTAPRD